MRLLSANAAIGTACSTVFLAVTHAFKVRKPVDLGYLNFTTLAARQHASREEVRLNEALAPGVYQAIDTIARHRDTGALTLVPEGSSLPAETQAVDVAVRMRLLPASGMLPAILGQRDLTAAERNAIVTRLAAFHAAAPSGPDVARFGSPNALADELLGNLDQITPLLAPLARSTAQSHGGIGIIAPDHITQLRAWMASCLASLDPLIRARAASGRIREGHGDLHAGNICLDPAAVTPDNPTGLVIFDRLEFRADFRCKDVAAELAGLAASLDGCAKHDLADELVSEYARLTSDPQLLTIEPLYRAHYAAVRAKVHAIQAHQFFAARAVDQASAHADLATRHVHQALGCTRGPTLLVACGLPGSGKSFVARLLGPPLRARLHRADEIRKRLAGLNPTDRGGTDLYSAAMSARTYAHLLARCERELAQGHSALADATFRDPALRAPFLALAKARGVPAIILHCHADEAETRRRIDARSARNDDASDADWAVYQRMAPAFRAPSATEATVIRVEPGIRASALLDSLLRAIPPATLTQS